MRKGDPRCNTDQARSNAIYYIRVRQSLLPYLDLWESYQLNIFILVRFSFRKTSKNILLFCNKNVCISDKFLLPLSLYIYYGI